MLSNTVLSNRSFCYGLDGKSYTCEEYGQHYGCYAQSIWQDASVVSTEIEAASGTPATTITATTFSCKTISRVLHWLVVVSELAIFNGTTRNGMIA